MPFGRVVREGGVMRVMISRKRQRGRALLNLAIAASFFAYAFLADGFVLWRILMGILALVPVTVGVIAWRRAASSSGDFVLLELGNDGIRFGSGDAISWDEIEDVRLFSILGQKALGIWTADPDLPAKRSGKPWVFALTRLNRLLGWPPSSVTGASVELTPLVEEIERLRPGLVTAAR